MTDDAIKAMKKEVSSKKRIAMEWASQVHDLVEDRLLTAYDELPDLAQKTVDACQEWAKAKESYDQAQR